MIFQFRQRNHFRIKYGSRLNDTPTKSSSPRRRWIDLSSEPWVNNVHTTSQSKYDTQWAKIEQCAHHLSIKVWHTVSQDWTMYTPPLNQSMTHSEPWVNNVHTTSQSKCDTHTFMERRVHSNLDSRQNMNSNFHQISSTVQLEYALTI